MFPICGGKSSLFVTVFIKCHETVAVMFRNCSSYVPYLWRRCSLLVAKNQSKRIYINKLRQCYTSNTDFYKKKKTIYTRHF